MEYENQTLYLDMFSYLIDNEDLSKFKSDIRYFGRSAASYVFSAIVELYHKEKRLIKDSNIIYDILQKSKDADKENVTVTQIKMLLNHNLSNNYNSPQDVKWLESKINEQINLVLVKNEVLNLIDNISEKNSQDATNIKKVAQQLGITYSINEDIEDEEDINSDINNTPLLSDNIFNNLPNFFKNIVKHFDNNRERDLVLLSSLSTISVLFDNAYIKWNKHKDKPNLFLFIAAPPSSGKSNMKYARMLLDKYLDQEREENKLLKFNAEKAALQTNKTTYEKPKQKFTLISANSSTAAFFEKLDINEGKGLLYTEEASEIGNSKNQDWGNYEEILRVAFHNESYSTNRKGEDIIYITHTYVSVAVSGTMTQLLAMFQEKQESGLFSRFMFYLFNGGDNWERNDYSNNDIDLESIFNTYSDKLFSIYNYYKDDEIQIVMSKEQMNSFDNYFEIKNNIYYSLYGANFKSSVNRVAVIARKMLMLFTLIRYYEDNNITNNQIFNNAPEKIMINDIDLNNCLDISGTLLQHAALVFNSFKYNNTEQKEVIIKGDKKEDLLNEMQSEFSYSQIKEIAESKFKMQAKTVERFLSNLTKRNVITKVARGHYKKN